MNKKAMIVISLIVEADINKKRLMSPMSNCYSKLLGSNNPPVSYKLFNKYSHNWLSYNKVQKCKKYE